MKILHIIAGLPPGAGMAESVPALCRHLRQLGHEVTLATLDGPLSDAARAAEAAGVRLVLFAPSWPQVLYFSWQMLLGLPALVRAADAVHVHSDWTFPVWWGCSYALRSGKPLVMSPRGTLNPVYLKHSAWKKRLVGWLDRYYLRRASVIQATCEAEAEWIEAFVGASSRGRTVVIPNGVEVREVLKCESSKVLKLGGAGTANDAKGRLETNELTSYRTNEPPTASAFILQPSSFSAGADRTRTVLYLGRLHPLKGLDLLIEAWGRRRNALVPDCENALVGKPEVGEGLTKELLPWQLVVAGPDEQGTLARLKAQADKLGLRVEDKSVNASMRDCINTGVLNNTVNKAITHSGPLEQSENHSANAESISANNAHPPDLIFIGPVYGEEKSRLMASADVFVLPTRSENFGLAVAEALACGVPVITTKGAPWSELENCGNALMRECVNDGEGESGSALMRECFNAQEDNQAITQSGIKEIRPVRAGWWIDVGVEPLAEALREAMSLTDEERQAMGENGRRLVEAKYRWETVAERMAEVYEKCVNAGLR